jgi:hypothetical protein
MAEWKYSFTIFTSALDGNECYLHALVTLQTHPTPKERAYDIHCVGGWVSPGAGLEISLALSGNQTPAGQTIVCHYTN